MLYSIVKLLLYAAAINFSLLALIFLFQRSLIYFPDKRDYLPANADVPEMEVIHLKTNDGLTIKAWYRPAQQKDRPTILYFHGNAGNIAHRGFLVRPFLDEDFGVLLLTYRGYSGNPGSPSENGLYNDARAAMTYLSEHNISNKCIVLYGNSIGAAVAIQMAVENNIGALILQSPFSSLTDVANIHYAFFMPFSGLIHDQFDSMKKAADISAPVLVLHGKDDTIVPPELSRKLIQLMPEPKEEHYLSGRGHNDLFRPDLVLEFIQRHVHCKTDRSF